MNVEHALIMKPDSHAEEYNQILDNLNSISVRKYYRAYFDIPWDDPDYQIVKNDHRWIFSKKDTIGCTSWYQSLPLDTQANLALDRTVFRVKLGVTFENILIRGMMAFSATLPNGSKEFRYVLHECMEEIQHSLMFQEFINRSGSNPHVTSVAINLLTRYMLYCARKFPELFFMFVLGGEEPIDLEQRKQLREQTNLHPLMKLINKIHITEEARHICFASNYIKQSVPKLSRWKKLKLKIMTPIILGIMGGLSRSSPSQLAKTYNMPMDVITSIGQDPQRTLDLQMAMKPIVELCREVKVLDAYSKPFWRWLSLLP